MSIFPPVFRVLLALLCLSHRSSATAITLSPEADTYVLGAEPEKNFGDAEVFQVRNSSNRKYSRIGYIRFHLGDKLTSRVEKARLTLFLASVFKDRPEPAEIGIYGWAGDAWDEMTLTDEKAFWRSARIANVPDTVRLLGYITVPPSGRGDGAPFPLESAELAEFLENARNSGEKEVTFLIVEKEPSPNVVTFTTKENRKYSPPSLEITLAKSN
jgi:hypothetical protein